MRKNVSASMLKEYVMQLRFRAGAKYTKFSNSFVYDGRTEDVGAYFAIEAIAAEIITDLLCMDYNDYLDEVEAKKKACLASLKAEVVKKERKL